MADVNRIKAKNGPDLILWGSSTLTSKLLEQGLRRRSCCSSIQSCWASGSASFRRTARPADSYVTGTKASSSGILINTYTLAKPLRSGSSDEAAV